MAVALDSAEVIIGTSNGPGLWVAPAGEAAPADLETPAGNWSLLGYVNEDGVVFNQSIETDTINAWQSKAPLRTVLISREYTVEFAMIQVNEVTAAMYFDQTEPTATLGEFTMDLDVESAPKEYAVLVVTKDGTILTGIHFQRAALSDVGELSLTKENEQAFPVTLSANADDGSVGTFMRQDTAAA